MIPKIRARFAPSPTGYLHVGSLRTVLYNWLFVRQNKGTMILRIEDTDRKRYVPDATEKLIEALDWIGLDWDEGPKLLNSKFKTLNHKLKIVEKGKFGPYTQSKRLEIYQKYAKDLIEKGAAYYCFCTPERLEKLRQEQAQRKEISRYDRTCRHLSASEISQKLKAKMPYIIRLKVPEFGSLEFTDLIRGRVSFSNELQEDAVLQKSDGYPTYHLASVIDDHLMKISHIIRGEEWLSSVPKHILLYQAFNWPMPHFAHISLLLNKDRSKLSKRQGDVGVEDYRVKGYLPEAIINFSAMLGWNPGCGEEQEIFSLRELIKLFSLKKMNKSGAVFDLEKLDWMNGAYIRRKKIKDLTKLCLPYLVEAKLIEIIKNKSAGSQKLFKIVDSGEIVNLQWLEKVIAMEQERIKNLSEISKFTEFFFREPYYDRGLLGWKKMTENDVKNNLILLAGWLEKITDAKFKKEILEKEILELIKNNNLGVGEMLWPMRVALTGEKASPGPFEIAEVLGKEKTIKRLEEVIKKL